MRSGRHVFAERLAPSLLWTIASSLMATTASRAGQCAKRGLAVEGATVYVNADICITCAILLISSGVVRVVVRRDHKGTSDGIDLLRKCGVEVDEWA